MFQYCNEINEILSDFNNCDKARQQAVFDYTYDSLKAIAIRHAYDKSEYEDILMEAYWRIFKYGKNLSLQRDGFGWMCRIVMNVAYDFNKKAKKYELLGDEDLELPSSFKWDTVFAEVEVRPLLKKLDEDERQLMYLRFFYEYSFDTIAVILNSNKSTVYRHYNRVIKKLKKMLTG